MARIANYDHGDDTLMIIPKLGNSHSLCGHWASWLPGFAKPQGTPLEFNLLVLQVDFRGESTPSLVMAAPSRRLVLSPPVGPRQDAVFRRPELPHPALEEPAHFWQRQRQQRFRLLGVRTAAGCLAPLFRRPARDGGVRPGRRARAAPG